MRRRRGYKRSRYGRRYRRRLFRRRGRYGRRYGRRSSWKSRITKKKVGRMLTDTLFIKFKYVERYQLDNQGVSNVQSLIFRGNSIFDPFYTGTGHEPTSKDQWEAFYGNYMVLGSKISVRFMCEDTTEDDSIICYVFPDNSFTYPGGTVVLEENPYVRYKHLQSPVTAPKSCCTIKSYMSTKKFFGRPISQDFTYFGATMTSNPLTTWYWQIAILNPYQVHTPTVQLYVTLTYYTRLYNRLDPLPYSN